MASLSRVTVGERTEFDRVMADAGFDASMLRRINKKPELARPWVAFGRELLAGKATTVDRKTTLASASKIVKRNGAYCLRTTRQGLTDAQIVEDFRKAGWGYINPAIRADRRIEVPGKPEIAPGTERMLTIKNVVPSGTTWKLQKAVDTIGETAMAYDLEDLRNMVLDNRDELLKRGVRYVVAPAARFAGDGGGECVVCAGLGGRGLDLRWVEDDWSDNDFFGSSKLAR